MKYSLNRQLTKVDARQEFILHDVPSAVDAIISLYGLAGVKDIQLILSFSGSLALKVTAEEETYIAKILFRASDVESVILEDEIFEYFKAIGRTNLGVIKNFNGELVSRVIIGNREVFVVLYPLIPGKTKEINTVTQQELRLFIKAIADLHTDLAAFIPRSNRRMATEHLLDADYLTEFIKLLSQNHNKYDAAIIKKLRSHISNIEKVQKYLESHCSRLQQQIIHADLASSNVLFDDERVNIIDFGHVGYGTVEWDIAVAIACWVRWQDLYNFSGFMLFFKKVYKSINPSAKWDTGLILSMVQARYYNTLIHSLRPAESEGGYEGKRYILEDHLYWLAEAKKYEKTFVDQTRVNFNQD